MQGQVGGQPWSTGRERGRPPLHRTGGQRQSFSPGMYVNCGTRWLQWAIHTFWSST